MPYLCYIDEAGNTECLKTANADAQPVMVIAGLLVNQQSILPLTKEFIDIKRNFYPKLFDTLKHDLEGLRVEIKGSDVRSSIRKHIAKGEAKELRYRLRFCRGLLDLLKRHHARLVGTVWIKSIGKPMDSNAVYTTSVQHICKDFHHLIASKRDIGFVIADFRDPGQNNIVAHAVATQKLKATGDAFPRILEAPTFGISHNHASLQLTDFLCSTLLFPMAVQSYCSGHVQNVHVRAEDARIKDEFGGAIKQLQYRFKKKDHGKFIERGGIYVCDGLLGRGAWHLFN